MMRILVDIREEQVATLNDLARRERQSRAALIRVAIYDYLAQHAGQSVEQGFGLWGSHGEDGVTYQERLRREW